MKRRNAAETSTADVGLSSDTGSALAYITGRARLISPSQGWQSPVLENPEARCSHTLSFIPLVFLLKLFTALFIVIILYCI